MLRVIGRVRYHIVKKGTVNSDCLSTVYPDLYREFMSLPNEALIMGELYHSLFMNKSVAFFTVSMQCIHISEGVAERAIAVHDTVAKLISAVEVALAVDSGEGECARCYGEAII